MKFNRTELKTLLPILIAIENGQTVECRGTIGEWYPITQDVHTTFYFDESYEFRVKPEQKLVPFTFEDAESLIGKVVKTKNGGNIIGVVISIFNCVISMGGDKMTYNDLYRDFTFLDGSPCGKYINE